MVAVRCLLGSAYALAAQTADASGLEHLACSYQPPTHALHPTCRRQPLAEAAEGPESPTQQEALVQAELLADYDTAALLGLMPSSSRPQVPARLGRSSSSSSHGSSLSSAFWAVGGSSFGASRSSSFSRSGSSTPVSEDAGQLLEKEGCRLRPAWWDDAMGLVACKMMVRGRMRLVSQLGCLPA